MHNKPATNRTLKSKLLLPGLLLANLLAFGILLWQDWGEIPVAKLPPLYWLLYAAFLCVLVAAIMVGRSQTRSMRAAIILASHIHYSRHCLCHNPTDRRVERHASNDLRPRHLVPPL